MNKKGFTLIETIVAFAILTIAGSMLLFGFKSATVLFADGSRTQHTSDSIYEEIINKENYEQTTTLTITLRDEDKVVTQNKTISNVGVTKLSGENGNHTLTFNKVAAAYQNLEWYPTEVEPEEPIVPGELNVEIRLLIGELFPTETNNWGRDYLKEEIDYKSIKGLDKNILKYINPPYEGLVEQTPEDYMIIERLPIDRIDEIKNDKYKTDSDKYEVDWWAIVIETKNNEHTAVLYGYFKKIDTGGGEVSGGDDFIFAEEKRPVNNFEQFEQFVKEVWGNGNYNSKNAEITIKDRDGIIIYKGHFSGLNDANFKNILSGKRGPWTVNMTFKGEGI